MWANHPRTPASQGAGKVGRHPGRRTKKGDTHSKHLIQPSEQKMRQVRPKEASDVPKAIARRPVLGDQALRAVGKLTALLLPAQGPSKEVRACIQ